ncbi:MAG: hybrid sensor histidine kinase/response regulator [Rickettsiales bacterium]
MDDLISEFIIETSESLSVLDNELISLEQNPEDEEILGNIFRVMHTIKGTCGFLGLPRLEGVAHAGENVLGKIRDKELQATPQAISLVLESLDCIKELIDHLSENGAEPEGDDSVLKGRLNQFAETGALDDAAPAEAPVAEAAASEDGGVPDEVIAEVNGAGDDAFPHFKGEDDPEMAAAIEKLMAEQAAAEGGASQENAPQEMAPAAEEKPATETPPPAEKPSVKPVASAAKPAAAPAAKKEGGATDTANQSIRVSLNVLENLMQTVSELVLTRNQLMQLVRTQENKEFATPLQQLSHITTELQDNVMKTRMQPIGNAWSKFPRLIRDLSMELGKKIELKMKGADTELDRQLLEVIKDPLTHMVRNSCDHGLETPDARVAAGKSETGTVTLSAYHEGGHIIIDIIDDGKGIPVDKVKEKAIANGVATEAEIEAMSDKQIIQFIFAPGFSTAEQVTAVSGRGVGMDVVRTNIEKIGGAIDLDSTWGKGSKVSIKIPLTLAIVSVLLVETQGQKFGIPQINVLELVRVSPSGPLTMEILNDSPVLRLRGKLLPLGMLSGMLNGKVDLEEIMQKDMYVAVCKVGSQEVGVVVERVHDTEEIVVKPVSGALKSLDLYSGNTILGDGSVIMILDPNGLAKAISNSDVAAHNTEEATAQNASEKPTEHKISFLLFDLGKGAPKAVPLEMVSRLEEVDVKSIEIADDYPVVQYRDDLMRLITLDDSYSMPDEGNIDVIVFSYDGQVIGLVVQEILDIVRAPFDIKVASKDSQAHGYLGSMVIEEKTTDVVDVAHLITKVIGVDVNVNMKHQQDIGECEVLLVEDSPFFRNLTEPFLQAAGYKVTTAVDAKAALAQLADKKFDMIVTDIEMPGMNGFEFAETCRSNAEINGVPIVAYTSTISDEVIARTKTSGMQDCIVKTDRPGLLESMSKCILENREMVA